MNPYLLKYSEDMAKQGQSLDQMLGTAFFTPSDQLAPTQQNANPQAIGAISPNGGQAQMGGGMEVQEGDREQYLASLGQYGLAPSPSGGGGGQYGRLSPYADTYAAIERERGLPAGYLMHAAGLESSYGKNLKNPNSSASGPFQFIDSTAAQMGLSPNDVMDPVRSAVGAADLAVEAMPMLRNMLGREPTNGELYLAHQQGMGGAKALLSNPSMNVVDALSTIMPREKAVNHVRLNGGDTNMTANEFSNIWTRKTPAGQAPSQYDIATYGDISPRRGDRNPEQVDELGQMQMDELDQEIDENTLSDDDKKKQHRGMLLMAIGKGLSQMSAGQDVDIMSVVSAYHERQDAYRKRIDDLKRQKRGVMQRAQERQYQVEDIEDAQAQELRIQELERRAGVERQITEQVFTAGQAVLDRDLNRELQAGKITSDQYMQERGLQHDILMQMNDYGFKEQYAKNRYGESATEAAKGRAFTTSEREAGQDFTLDRDASQFGYEERLQDNDFVNKYTMLKDTQKFEHKQNALQRAFQMGMSREERQFSSDEADEQRAYEMGRDGRLNEFQKGIEELRYQHTQARDETLDQYARRTAQEEREYLKAQKTEVGTAMADAITPYMEGMSPERQAAVRGAIIASPEGGVTLAQNLITQQKEEEQKKLELEKRAELAEILRKEGASESAVTLAMNGNEVEAMKKFGADRDVPFEVYDKMTDADKLDYLRYKSSATNIDPTTKAMLDINIKEYETAAANADTYNKIGDQAKAMMDVLNRNPNMKQGVYEAKTLFARKLAADFGLSDTEDMDDQQLFQAMAANIARLSHVSGTGAQSDKDVALNLQAQAGLEKSPAANRLLLQLQIGNQDRANVEKNALADFVGMGGGSAEDRDKFVAKRMKEAGLDKPIVPVVEGGAKNINANRDKLKVGDAFAVREGDKTKYYFLSTNADGIPTFYDANGNIVPPKDWGYSK